ncbi:MAG TPA: hypothetical protein VED40_17695 [Azospirillaceae bacterium]|nr:hypothetical protein [Azospirillaceae bacterium]
MEVLQNVVTILGAIGALFGALTAIIDNYRKFKRRLSAGIVVSAGARKINADEKAIPGSQDKNHLSKWPSSAVYVVPALMTGLGIYIMVSADSANTNKFIGGLSFMWLVAIVSRSLIVSQLRTRYMQVFMGLAFGAGAFMLSTYVIQ